MIQEVVIYYFSGTGNAKNVVTWFCDYAKNKGFKTSLVPISKLNHKPISLPPENTIIGFCSPTHGFNFPPIMLNFLARFPKGRHRIFIMNTRAGMKLNKLFLPGLSGLALYFALFVLKSKGYKIKGLQSIDLPSNWLSIHPGIKTSVIISIQNRCKHITQKFTEKILSGKRSFLALYDIVQDIAIAPVSILYYLFGRFVFAKSFIANRNCDNCGLCIKSCAVKAIKLVDNKPFWTYKCESCMKCMNQCPKRAIQTCHGFIVFVLFIVYSFVLAFLYEKLPLMDYKIFKISIIRFSIETIILFPFLLSGYRLMHFLMRFGIMERLISYTSLTWYKFWRRYKPFKN